MALSPELGPVGETEPVAANVLILGCGRSGTSIFGELFESLPGFVYVSEPLLSQLPAVGADTQLAVKVPRTEPDDHPPPGLPVAPADMFDAMPQPLVVFWQVRHPLDAVSSLRVGIGQGWAHHPRPPDWRDWLERPLVERCAHHWAVINGNGYDEVCNRAVVNRFETMIHDPLAFAHAAIRAIGVDPASVGPELATWAGRVQDTANDRFVEARTSRRHSRPDHVHRVGRWRENLTPEEVATITPIVAPAATRLGYDLSS